MVGKESIYTFTDQLDHMDKRIRGKPSMSVRTAYITVNNRKGRITGTKFVKYDTDDWNLCYEIKFDDGNVDYIPLSDTGKYAIENSGRYC